MERSGEYHARIAHPLGAPTRAAPSHLPYRAGSQPARADSHPMRRINDRLLSWASILEPATEAQAKLAATMPFIHPHVALMPDAHLGLGATVGSVIPTLRAVMPAAV